MTPKLLTPDHLAQELHVIKRKLQHLHQIRIELVDAASIYTLMLTQLKITTLFVNFSFIQLHFKLVPIPSFANVEMQLSIPML